VSVARFVGVMEPLVMRLSQPLSAQATSASDAQLEMLRLLTLVVKRQESLAEDMSSVRSTIESVDSGTAAHAMRLERIEQHLRESARHRPAAAAAATASVSVASPQALVSDGSARDHVLLLTAAVLCWLLSRPRSRRLLRRLPLAALLMGQLLATSGLAVVRGLDYWDGLRSLLLVGSGRNHETEDVREARRRRLRALACLALFICTALLPAKGVAHVEALLLGGVAVRARGGCPRCSDQFSDVFRVHVRSPQ